MSYLPFGHYVRFTLATYAVAYVLAWLAGFL
jgi:hypothetical protein